MKSVNLQYNTQGQWVDGSNDSSTKHLMFQVFFFSKNLAKFFAKTLSIYFSVNKIAKMKIKSFECPKSIRNYEKKILVMSDTWSTSCLSHRPIKPAHYNVDCQIYTALLRFNNLKTIKARAAFI